MIEGSMPMFNFFKKTIIAVHSGHFHADDAFAVAVLRSVLTYDKSLGAGNVLVKRTRDENWIARANYVVDVGRVYDASKNRFDHHQQGGAGERDNGIPYAAFGLVWKHYGARLCEIVFSQNKKTNMFASRTNIELAVQRIDEKLVQPIDAVDNGVAIVQEKFSDIRPYDITTIISGMNPEWNEKSDEDDSTERFLTAVSLAEDVLIKEIQGAIRSIEAAEVAMNAYHAAEDKRLIIFDRYVPTSRVFAKLPEPLFVVYPQDSKWHIKAVKQNLSGFENRKDLPLAWAGKVDEALEAATGVKGATFCHNKRFIAVAKTREAILTMAKIALEA
jgi:uncharacterized UPF0160 family protein